MVVVVFWEPFDPTPAVRMLRRFLEIRSLLPSCEIYRSEFVNYQEIVFTIYDEVELVIYQDLLLGGDWYKVYILLSYRIFYLYKSVLVSLFRLDKKSCIKKNC